MRIATANIMDHKLICTFYQKIGACRHGEKCSRRHIRPTQLRTVLLANLYQKGDNLSERQVAETFGHFYGDVYRRVAQEGEVDQVVVCENENFHLNGNVYVRYTSAAAAAGAVLLLNQEWYAGRPVYCELSPVTSFAEANCRAYDTNSCTRGDHCNFMHVRRPANELRGRLRQAQDKKIALDKIRSAVGDPKWGEQWEQPGTRAAERPGRPERLSAQEAGAEKEQAKAEKEESIEKTADAEQSDEESKAGEESKTDAVARLFGLASK